MSEVPHYELANAGQHRDPRLTVGLLIIEKAEGHPQGRWYLAGALTRSAQGVGWATKPMQGQVDVHPELAWEYWSEKSGNGYNDAVFQYWVESLAAAEELVEVRRRELEQGRNPYYGQAQKKVIGLEQVEPVQVAPFTDTPVGEDDDEPDPHALGDERALTRSLSQTLIWRLVSELVRRHPRRLWVHVEGGGMYDRINIIDITGRKPSHLAVLNAAGTNTSTPAGTGLLWTRAHRDDTDPSDWVREFERRCGLRPTQGQLPASTPSSLAVRWVSTFLLSQIGSRRAWFTQSAYQFDPDQTAKTFPDALEWQRTHEASKGPLIHLGHLNDVTPRLIASQDGDLWRDNGEYHYLPALHRARAPITALLLRTVPDMLP